MSTALVPIQQAWSREQVDLIKRTICKGATDDELTMFVQTSQRLGLDPFARQVFAVKRWDGNERREVMSIQVSIDGFRLVAERTGKYAGQLGPLWTADGKEWREVWLDSKPPAAAKVGVMRHDFKEPVWSVATWEQYKQTKRDGGLTSMWSKMGPLMLAKCAESLALRRAFPNELSGVYTSEEMAQATVEVVETPPKEATAPAASAAPQEAEQNSPADSADTAGKAPRANTIRHDGVMAVPKQIALLHVLRAKAEIPDCDGNCAKEVPQWSKKANAQVTKVLRCVYHTQLAAFKDQQGNPITTSKALSVKQISNLIDRYQAKIEKQAKATAEVRGAPPLEVIDGDRKDLDELEAAFDGSQMTAAEVCSMFNVDNICDLDKEQAGQALALVTAHGTRTYQQLLDRIFPREPGSDG